MKYVSRLTDKEIMDLIPFYQIYDFMECEPAELGTRKFSIQPTYGGPYVDVTIGDAYDIGDAKLYGVKEEDFLKFMLKKFGKEYFEWYCEYVKDKAMEDSKEYMERKAEEVKEKISFCKRVLSE